MQYPLSPVTVSLFSPTLSWVARERGEGRGERGGEGREGRGGEREGRGERGGEGRGGEGRGARD